LITLEGGLDSKCLNYFGSGKKQWDMSRLDVRNIRMKYFMLSFYRYQQVTIKYDKQYVLQDSTLYDITYDKPRFLRIYYVFMLEH